MTSKNRIRLSRQSQKTLVDGMMSQFHYEVGNEIMDAADKLTVSEIVSAASEAGIDADLMGGAYFVFTSGSFGTTRLRLEFDLAFSKSIGPEYAKQFVAEAERLESSMAAQKSNRRRAEEDMKKTRAGKPMN